jgi:exopolyphosphatase/guanosine-5'-triphosphate,3'-diphosphate pyrophosphatase
MAAERIVAAMLDSAKSGRDVMDAAPVRARRRRKPRAAPIVAALDLGTNNCRLLVASVGRDGTLRVVDSFSRIVRLGEGVAQTGRLSEAAIARTIEALKICAHRIGKSRASRVRAIATEAARRASNADELVARVRAETGLMLEVVSAEEEARLAAIGCAPLIGTNYEGALVFDIGGGSTEVIWMRGHGERVRMVQAASVPLGVVSMSEQGSAHDFDTMRTESLDALQRVRHAMDATMSFDANMHHLLGTSGTVTTLAGIALGLKRYDRAKVDASWHDCARILEIVDALVGLDLAERAKVGCVGPDRADLIVAGCAVFSAIHVLWPCARLRVADRGLREGMLRELAAVKQTR